MTNASAASAVFFVMLSSFSGCMENKPPIVPTAQSCPLGTMPLTSQAAQSQCSESGKLSVKVITQSGETNAEVDCKAGVQNEIECATIDVAKICPAGAKTIEAQRIECHPQTTGTPTTSTAGVWKSAAVGHLEDVGDVRSIELQVFPDGNAELRFLTDEGKVEVLTTSNFELSASEPLDWQKNDAARLIARSTLSQDGVKYSGTIRTFLFPRSLQAEPIAQESTAFKVEFLKAN